MPPRKPTTIDGYFDEKALLIFACELQNKRNAAYKGLVGCLKPDYLKKLPSDFLYHDDIVLDEFLSILDAENKLEVIWSLDRYKHSVKLTLWRRILLWLAR